MKQKPKLFLKSLLLLVIASAITLLACNKSDFNSDILVSNTNNTTNFYEGSNATPLLQRIAAKLKEKGLNNAFITTQGYALWAKAMVTLPKQNATARTAGDDDTTVIIPLVLENTAYVNSFIEATAAGDIDLRLVESGDYKEHPYKAQATANEITAEDYALYFMNLDEYAFGSKTFKILDENLFKMVNNGVTYTNPKVTISVNRFTLASVQVCADVWVENINPAWLTGPDGHFEWQCTTLWSGYLDGEGEIGGGAGGGIPSTPNPGGTPSGNPGGGGGGGTSTPPWTPPATPNPHPPIGWIPLDDINDIEEWHPEDYSEIDIEKYLKCFGNAQPANLVYKVSLNVDIPVNSFPSWPINVTNASPGHVFLTLTKTNPTTNEVITQSFGFYPGQDGSQCYNTVPGKMVDNGEHEINASLEMTVSGISFIALLNKIRSTAHNPYHLAFNNCGGFAIPAFNSIRDQASQIIPNTLTSLNPCNIPTTGEIVFNSPKTTFNLLKAMKTNNHPEANNIRIEQNHNYKAPNSHGPCN